MKIQSLSLRDFRAYAEASISFDEPLCIVRGGNHSGKSSLVQALQLAITKRTNGTTAAGAGHEDKIRQGAKKAMVAVGLETLRGPVAIEMIQKAGSRNYSIPSGFEEYLNANAVRWSCVLEPEFFIEQDEKMQKAILAALIAPSEYAFDAEMVALADKHLMNPVPALFSWDNGPIDIIEALYSAAFKARTAAKIALDCIHIPTVPPSPEYTIEAIQEYLTKLHGELTEERVVTATSNTREIAGVEAELREKERELGIARNRLESQKERIRDAEQLMLSGPAMTKVRKTAEGRAKFNECEGALVDIRRKIKDLTGSIETVQELTAEEGECPTCKRALDEATRDDVCSALRSQIAGLRASENERLSIQKDLGDIAGAEARIRDHETAKEGKLEAVRTQTAAGEEITTLGKDIVRLNNRLNELHNQSAAPAAEPSNNSEVRIKIEAWDRKLAEATRYEAVKQQAVNAEARRAEQLAVVDELERLVAYFGKDGVKADIIKSSITDFAAVVNGVLAYWGYSCELAVEPYRFIVTTSDGFRQPLKELSGSERLFFGAALQSAIAIQSGIRLVVVDKADVLIDEDRGALFNALNDLLAEGHIDQAIVLVADNRTEVPEQPGVAFYRVRAGRIERLGVREETAA